MSVLHRLLVLLLSTFLLGIPLPSLPARAAEDRDLRTTAPGFSIPHPDGAPGSWIGSYSLRGTQAYCIDPRRRGSTTAALDGQRRVLLKMNDVRGEAVPTRNLERAAWIASTAGVTTSRVEAAAVDTALYALLGRGRYAWGARRSEARMRATGHYARVRALARELLRSSARLAGAQRLRITAPSTVYDAAPVTVTASVTTATGVPLAGVTVLVDHPLDDTGPKPAVTRADGSAAILFTPVRAGTGPVTAIATGLPTRFPEVLVPADRRFQRLAIAGLTHDLTRTVPTTISPAPVSITTVTSAQTLEPGGSLTDTVTVVAPSDFRAVVTARLHGPFRRRPGPGDCAEDLVAGTVTRAWTGSGTFVTAPVGPLLTPGFYTWVESVPATATTDAATTECGELSETSLVRRYQPSITTRTSASRALVGTLLSDTVTVTGLPAGDRATITAHLVGPFPSREAIRCDGPSRTVRLAVTGSGTWRTPSLAISRPGWYSWYEVLPASDVHEGVRTPCAVVAETSLVTRRPAPAVHIDSGPDSAPASGRAPAPYAALDIPSAGIGVTAVATQARGGVLEPPTGAGRVGWYSATARATDAVGSMVVGGHVATASGGLGPFGGLRRVEVGDRVILTRDGVRRPLTVVAIRTFPRTRPLPDALFDPASPFRVVLVTCTHKVTRADGSWHYTDNLVVIAR